MESPDHGEQGIDCMGNTSGDKQSQSLLVRGPQSKSQSVRSQYGLTLAVGRGSVTGRAHLTG